MFGQMSQSFGQTLCESYICGIIFSFGSDFNEQIRKKAIQQLPLLVVALSQKFIGQKVLPFLTEYANDNEGF